MKRALFYMLILPLCISCGTLCKVPQPNIQHDTLVVYKNNTVHEKDSVYFWKDRFIYTKGDTVFNTITEYKYRDRIKEVHDTLYRDKVKIEKVPEYIEKELTNGQKTLMKLGKAFIVLVLGLLVYIGIKIYKKLRI